MKNEYNNLDFCINMLNDYLDSKDFDKYRIEPIVISEIDIDNILKSENFDFKNILSNLQFYKKLDDKYIYFSDNYEVNISKYTGNRNLLSTKENVGLVFNYILSELVTLNKINNMEPILLNLMNYSIKKKEINDKINLNNFEDNDLLLISIFERRNKTLTLSDFIKKNKLSLSDYKLIFLKVLFILERLTNKYKNFRHNNLNLDSIRISFNKDPKMIQIDDNTKFMDKFILKFTNFEDAYADSISKKTLKNISKENPYYDIHYFFSSFMNYCLTNKIDIDEKVKDFINQIVPEKYRNYENKKFKLDEEYYLSNETDFIIAKDLIKNIFFDDIINNNIENMNLSASPISITESSLQNYKKKENKINYDIDSLTESQNNSSRMFAKNIKYKNKKTYSQSNNIKNTMIKGTRRLYVPTKNVTEGNMSSDILSNVENDVRDKRRDRKKERKDDESLEKRREEVEENEVEDESSIESTENKMSRSKKSSKKGSKKSKKSKKFNSESSLTSLSSDEVDSQALKNSTKLNTAVQAPASVPALLNEGLLGAPASMPMPQSMPQMPQMNTGVASSGLNSIGKLLGHSPNMQPPSNLPMTDIPIPQMSQMEGSMGMNMNLPQAQPQLPMMEQMSQMQGLSQMNGMPNLSQMQALSGMPQLQGMSQFGMPQMGMPQMAPNVQSVNLNEASLAPTAQPNGLTFDKLMTQQGGSLKNKKVQLKLKKDFFF
jgi:hypothetical protein